LRRRLRAIRCWQNKLALRLVKSQQLGKNWKSRYIAFIARDDQNLEGTRVRYESELNRNIGHDMGSILWTQVCEGFASNFADDMARQNREWCKEARAPWVLLNVEDNDEVY
jgi:hypothetical protein